MLKKNIITLLRL